MTTEAGGCARLRRAKCALLLAAIAVLIFGRACGGAAARNDREDGARRVERQAENSWKKIAAPNGRALDMIEGRARREARLDFAGRNALDAQRESARDIARLKFAVWWDERVAFKRSAVRAGIRSLIRQMRVAAWAPFAKHGDGDDVEDFDVSDRRHVVFQHSSETTRAALCDALLLSCTRLYSSRAIDALASPTQLSALLQHPHVLSIGFPTAQHKLSGKLVSPQTSPIEGLDVLAPPSSPRLEKVRLIAVLKRMIDARAAAANAVIKRWHKESNAAIATAAVAECSEQDKPPQGLLESAQRDFSDAVIRVDVGRDDVDAAARWLSCRADVVYVHTATTFGLLNKYAVAFAQSGDVQRVASLVNAPLWANGVLGGSQKIHVADTGIDYDNCFFRDSNALEDNIEVTSAGNHCYPSKRKIRCYFSTADYMDSQEHGTHVTGTATGFHAAAADMSVSEMLELELDHGHAPHAELVFTDIGLPNGALDVPSNLADDFLGEAYDAGARVSSHSWGCFDPRDPLACNTYDVSARSVDEFMWRNMDMLVLFAAGNSGLAFGADSQGMRTVGTPGTSKNQISVGAAQTSRPSAGKCSGDLACSPENVAGFSSRGPTRDGRYKPDLVFPGERIISAASSGDPFDGFYDGSSCAPPSPRNLNTLSGTSMATPAVAGIAALVRDYFELFDARTGRPLEAGAANSAARDGRGPTGAAVKCILVHAARLSRGFFPYLDGVRLQVEAVENAEDPKAIAGRGLLGSIGTNTLLLPLENAEQDEDLVNSTSGRVFFLYDRYMIANSTSDVDIEFRTVGAGSLSTIKVTMVYTDAPGPVVEDSNAPVLINDLDLSVVCVGSQCAPSLVSASSQSRIDNVEQIYNADDYGELNVYADDVDPTDELTLRVTISAREIEDGPQHFALVITGKNLVETRAPADNYVPVWTNEAVRSGGGSGVSLSTGAIIGIAVGAFVVVILAVALVYVVCVRGTFQES
eukprot:CAMPEP_0185831928 /NCGR_PEP_ID=MMETSP1353-20130828/1782_1 /TAXON_ID=1077150 /ORGANISM="Erythrolobus australicus, Strain CCMP3124" /LENGTH=979 /DNA_ID=CAMNT_0028530045 /DNA_START=268 /DNA_END=3207 /DNA_ORIENTATION=-